MTSIHFLIHLMNQLTFSKSNLYLLFSVNKKISTYKFLFSKYKTDKLLVSKQSICLCFEIEIREINLRRVCNMCSITHFHKFCEYFPNRCSESFTTNEIVLFCLTTFRTRVRKVLQHKRLYCCDDFPNKPLFSYNYKKTNFTLLTKCYTLFG